MPDDKILDRIKKLLALAESPNEAEAASAAEKANAMLAQYRITMADLPSNEQPDAPIGTTQDESTSSSPWIRGLWGATAKLNFCAYLYSSGSHRTYHYIIGDEASSVATQSMATYLTQTVNRLARKARKEQGETSKFERSFKKGAAASLINRLNARTAELRAGKDSQNNIANANNLPALYESNDKALAAYIKDEFGQTKATRARAGNVDANAFHQGVQAGKNVGINTQIGSTAASATLQLGAR